MQRLSKVIAQSGVASRRAAEKLIFDGKVRVNKKECRIPQTLVCLSKDIIEVEGKRIKAEEEKVYFILNKPTGYLCSRSGAGKKVFELIDDKYRLFSVGRLDKDTSGLLLLTNDGEFSHRIQHPSFEVPKEYLVKTRSEITDEHLKQLGLGTEVEGKWVRPTRVKKVRKGTLKIVVKEGRKHEVRELVKSAKLELISLARIRVGGLELGALSLGQARSLTPLEIEMAQNL